MYNIYNKAVSVSFSSYIYFKFVGSFSIVSSVFIFVTRSKILRAPMQWRGGGTSGTVEYHIKNIYHAFKDGGNPTTAVNGHVSPRLLQ
jgi:hypothetical protein